jgi:hypothetical protein
MPDAQSDRLPRLFFRRVRAVCLLLIVLALAAWCLLPPNVLRRVVILTRGADGTLQEQQPNKKDGLLFNAHLGGLTSTNQVVSGITSSHSNPAFFAARSMVVINPSDDILMERVGTELLEVIKKDLPLDRIEYYPSGHFPEPGGLGPDLYLRLDLTSKKVSGLLNSKLDAKVVVNLGTTLGNSSFNSFDQFTPPTVKVDSNISVEHQSIYTGVESSAAACTLQGRDIAKQIAARISKLFEDEQKKHRSVPELPVSLATPEYRPIPEFSFLSKLDAALMTSTHRLMIHNETFWQLRTEKQATELFAAIKPELIENGWQIDRDDALFPRSVNLRAVDGSRVLTVFPTDREQLPRTADEPQTGPVDYFIHYRDRVDRKTLIAAVDEMLARPDPDALLLIAFRSSASSDQNARIISIIEGQKPGTEAGWLALADHYSSRKDLDGVRRALRMLKCFEFLESNNTSIANKIRDVARKHKIDESEFNTPSREDWLEFGIVEISQEEPTKPIKFGFDTLAGFFLLDSDEKLHLYSVKITRTDASNPEATFSESFGGSRSWTSSGIFQGTQTTAQRAFSRRLDGQRGHLEVEKLADDRFRVSAEFTPREPVEDSNRGER